MDKVTYAFYREVYRGDMGETAFDKVAVQAAGVLLWVTQGRAVDVDGEGNVQAVMCAQCCQRRIKIAHLWRLNFAV